MKYFFIKHKAKELAALWTGKGMMAPLLMTEYNLQHQLLNSQCVTHNFIYSLLFLRLFQIPPQHTISGQVSWRYLRIVLVRDEKV